LVVLLAYVALDLCLPDMPGAFVFDASGSIESTEVVRTRLPGKIIVPLPTADVPLLRHGLAPVIPVSMRSGGQRRLDGVALSYRPRAACTSPDTSEDPH
jgi:hypothetical protein